MDYQRETNELITGDGYWTRRGDPLTQCGGVLSSSAVWLEEDRKRLYRGSVKLNIPARVLLWIAGVQSALLGGFHFLVPYVFPWEQHLETLYPPLRWALFAVNFAYSTLLLWGSLLTLIILLRKRFDRFMVRSTLAGMGLCWLSGAIYESVVPFPVQTVRWVVPGFALLTAALYLIPVLHVFATREPQSS